MRTTIVLATYNGSAHIEEQLCSYLEQTQLPDELVVSDDHSSDRTLDIVRSFKAHAPFSVRILENTQRVGYARNFARAMSAATGDLILLSDQDDVWLPTHVKSLHDAIDPARGVTFVLSPSLSFPDGSQPHESAYCLPTRWRPRRARRRGLWRDFFGGKLHQLPYPGHGRGFLRRHLKHILPIPKSWSSHDPWIASLLGAITEFAFVSAPQTFHRIHLNNTSPFGRHVERHSFMTDDNNAALSLYRRHIERWRDYIDRLSTIGFQTDKTRRAIRDAQSRIRFLEGRIMMLEAKLPRSAVVCLRMVLTGAYYRGCSSPGLSFVRDLLRIAGRRRVSREL